MPETYTNETYAFDELYIALNRSFDLSDDHFKLFGITWYPTRWGKYIRKFDEGVEEEELFQIDGRTNVRWFAAVTTDDPDAWQGTFDLYIFFDEEDEHADINSFEMPMVNNHWVDMVIDYRENYNGEVAYELYKTLKSPDKKPEEKEQALKQMMHITPIYFYAVEKISKDRASNTLQIEGTMPAVANNRPIFMHVLAQFSFTTGKLTVIPL